MAHQIQVTSDYSIFKFLPGNRPVNLAHVKKLEVSLEQGQLISPILVNDIMQIIDGQHRFTACKNLGLPVYYIVGQGYGIKEVQTLNTNTKDWKGPEYLNFYCELGIDPYLKFRQFQSMFPDFAFRASYLILSRKKTGVAGGDTRSKKEYITDANPKGLYSSNAFNEGFLVIPNWDQSVLDAHRILKVKEHYKGFNRFQFVSCMLDLFKRDNYNHERFLHKLRLQPGKLVHQNNATQYLEIIEQIYNYKCSAETKENLRF